jgi:hypothetical protein
MKIPFKKDAIAQHYDEVIGSQMSWRWKATQLLTAAKIIFKQAIKYKTVSTKFPAIGTKAWTTKESQELEKLLQYEVAGFLLALAVENLLKALWVGKNRPRVKNIERIDKQLNEICEYNLVLLCKKAEFSITDLEKTFLTALTETTFWRGRYPMPLKRTDYARYFEPGCSLSFIIEDSVKKNWPASVDNFIQRLNEALSNIPEKINIK